MEIARRSAGRGLARGARLGLPVALSGLTLWLLAGRLAPGDLADIFGNLAQVEPVQIAVAVLLSGISLWTVGRYDRVAHRHFQTGIDEVAACRSGIAAVALAQTLGFGVFTGGLVRWRMVPELGMAMALRLSTFVCLSFLGALGVLILLSCLLLAAPAGSSLPALILLAVIPLAIWLLWHHQTLRWGRLTLPLPSLRAAGAILFWAALDVGAAAAAFHVLLPDPAPALSHLLPVFLIAFAAALLSGAPGGVGPFEFFLLTLMPQVPPSELLGAVVLFRGVYYALPALLALAACAFPPAGRSGTLPFNASVPLGTAPRAEVGVIRQNGGTVLTRNGAALATWPTGQSRVALFDPITGHLPPLLPALSASARAENRFACLYKTSARHAAQARAAGWRAVRIAQEAVIVPAEFDLATPARRRLRRKLRQAEKAGVQVREATLLPLGDMARIDALWQQRRGTARGGSMGRFCPHYLSGQRVFLAYCGSDLVAFSSFHVSDSEWCLDLMRSGDSAPDGTMQALVHRAIDVAAAQGLPRISLAAVPDVPALARGPFCRIWRRCLAASASDGLRQFKAGFAPRWQPLYAAAPGSVALWVSLADIARSIYNPEPENGPGIGAADALPHNENEYNEVAPIMAS